LFNTHGLQLPAPLKISNFNNSIRQNSEKSNSFDKKRFSLDLSKNEHDFTNEQVQFFTNWELKGVDGNPLKSFVMKAAEIEEKRLRLRPKFSLSILELLKIFKRKDHGTASGCVRWRGFCAAAMVKYD